MKYVKIEDVIGYQIKGLWGDEFDELFQCTPVIKTNNMNYDGTIDFENITFRNIKLDSILNNYLKKGDLLIEKSGGTKTHSVGYVTYFDGEENKYVCNNFILGLRPDSKKINSKYLFYNLKYMYEKGDFSDCFNKTTGIQNLKTKFYLSKKIKMIELSKQIKIVDILDNITKQINDLKRELRNFDNIVKSQFIEMFGFIEEQDRWDRKKWGEVLKIQNGRDYKHILVETGGYPVYGTGGEMARANEYLCPENSIIVGRKGTINNPLLIKEKFWNVDTAFGVIPGDLLNYQYLYYFCKFFDFAKLNKAAVLPSTTKGDLLKIDINVPPIELQNKFADFVQQIDKSKYFGGVMYA